MLEIIIPFYVLFGAVWALITITLYADARGDVRRHAEYPILYDKVDRDEDLARCRFWARMVIAIPVWPFVFFTLAVRRGRELAAQLVKDAR